MKTLFQVILIIILMFTCFVTYNKYFNIKKNSDLKIYENVSKKNTTATTNNSIKDLSYIIKIQDGKEYIVKAKSGRISDINNSEVVLMKDVVAEIILKNKTSITIISNEAVYNALNYNTVFEKNVSVNYLNHIIKSNKILLDNVNEVIEMKDNVIYEGPYGKILSENLKIDLLTRNIIIDAKTPNNKVQVKVKSKNNE